MAQPPERRRRRLRHSSSPSPPDEDRRSTGGEPADGGEDTATVAAAETTPVYDPGTSDGRADRGPAGHPAARRPADPRAGAPFPADPRAGAGSAADPRAGAVSAGDPGDSDGPPVDRGDAPDRRRRTAAPGGVSGSGGVGAPGGVSGSGGVGAPGGGSGAFASGGDDRETERGLRGLVGSGSSQVSVDAALRARDAARPTDEDLAAAEERLVIVRRNWVPREDLPRNR